MDKKQNEMTAGKLAYWILWELLMTMSNKQSVFSSKKITNETLSVEEVSMICALLLGHGVYSMIMNAKDKKIEPKNETDATQTV